MTKVADALVAMTKQDKDKDKDKHKRIPTRPSSRDIPFTNEWPVVGGVHGQAIVSEAEASARVAAAVARAALERFGLVHEHKKGTLLTSHVRSRIW